MAKQGIPLVTCDYRLIPVNGTEPPAYHLKCIAPEPQGYETAKEKGSPHIYI